MTGQSRATKCTGWTSSIPSRGQALWFTGGPRVWEWPPVNYVLIPQRCPDLSNCRFSPGGQITPFTTKSKLLGIRCFKWKAHFAFLQRGGAGRGAPRRRPPAQLASCQGAGAGADQGMTADARRSRGLGGAQAVVGGGTAHLVQWVPAPAGLAKLACRRGGRSQLCAGLGARPAAAGRASDPALWAAAGCVVRLLRGVKLLGCCSSCRSLAQGRWSTPTLPTPLGLDVLTLQAALCRSTSSSPRSSWLLRSAPSSLFLPVPSGLQGSPTVGATASRHAAGRCAPAAHQDPALGGRRPETQLEIPLWFLTSPRLMFLTSFWTSSIGKRGRQAAMSWEGGGWVGDLLEGDGWSRCGPALLNRCPRALPAGQSLEELVVGMGTTSCDGAPLLQPLCCCGA